MKLVSIIKKKPFLFLAMVLVPFCLQAFLLVIVPKSGDVPRWAHLIFEIVVPLSTAIVGFFVAYGIALSIERWGQNFERFIKVYTACFTVSWVVVFGFLNLFINLIGMDVAVIPANKELVWLLASNLFGSIPLATILSLVICAIFTGSVIFLCELLK